MTNSKENRAADVNNPLDANSRKTPPPIQDLGRTPEKSKIRVEEDVRRQDALLQAVSNTKETPVENHSWLSGALLKYGSGTFGLPLRLRDTLALCVLAFFADLCLYKTPGATGVACVLTAALIGLPLIKWKRPQAKTLCVGSVVLLSAVLIAWDHWWLLEVVGWTSLLVLAITFDRSDWQTPELLWGAVATIACAPARFAGHFMALNMRISNPSGEQKRTIRLPLRVVGIPIAVCVLFIIIFNAANPVVARMTEKLGVHIVDLLSGLQDFISAKRIFIWLLWLALFATLIRPVTESWFAKLMAELDRAMTQKEETVADRGSFVTAIGTLVCVNILFVAYNAMDAIYLYFKATLPKGITWTDYTHAGCGWLTFGLFVSATVLGIIFAGRLNAHPRTGGLKMLAYIWAAQNGILAIGAIRRLQMYINHSGLTHLRITGLYGCVLVAIGLAIVIWKIRANRTFVWLFRKELLAFCVGLIILALTPYGYICSDYNVARLQEGKRRVLRPIMLKNLPPDGLPPLLALLDYERADGDHEKEMTVRKGIAGLLGLHLIDLRIERSKEWPHWQGAAAWAHKVLEKNSDKIISLVPVNNWASARDKLKRNVNL